MVCNNCHPTHASNIKHENGTQTPIYKTRKWKCEGDVWKGEKVGVKAVVGGRVEVMVVRKGKKRKWKRKRN